MTHFTTVPLRARTKPAPLWTAAARPLTVAARLRRGASDGPLQRSERGARWQAGVLVAGLFAALSALEFTGGETFGATSLLTVPIAIGAIEFGLWGGLAAGTAGWLLVLVWGQVLPGAGLPVVGYFALAVAFLLLGGLVGRFVTARRATEDAILRAERLSLDLMATAGFDGYFKRLNGAWERTLGWSAEELGSRHLVDFVHPDDRERTLSEVAKVTQGCDSIAFRNRYRTSDGSYRWLEWNAHADQQLIYASARDITILHEAEDAIGRHGKALERLVGERTAELEQARLEILTRLALAAEYRDDDTHQHTERVGRTSMLIARQIGLPEETVNTIRYAAALHDVGKLGICDGILLKPGKLTGPEYQTMQTHTRIGATILADSSSSVLRMAEEIALTHHERWDGTGYPAGLAAHDIPLVGRITALADVFDAITHKRPYKDAEPIESAIAEIRTCSGSHFDPAIVDAFLGLPHATLA